MSLLNNLIDSFSIQNLQNFLRDKMPSFKPSKEDIEHLLNDKEFENYQSILKIGEAILNNEDILVFASNTTEHLTERTGKKNQYEIAKRILKDDRKDAALFIFYDGKGDFRFSFVRANYLGTKRDFTDFKRYSYFVSPSLTNNTFIKQVGGCSFNSLDEIIKAFSVEPLNKLFYQDIAKSFYSLIGGSVLENKKIVERATTLIMPSNKTDNRKTLQEFGVRFIGRTIFCWFLKNKVSSNNKPLIPADWLSSTKVAETPDYYHTYLEKLFFEILNEKHSDRITELPDGHKDIPFLNGGLFEPQADDYYVRGTLGISKYLNTLKVPNEWIASFFSTLEQYNFTIDENSINDSEVSIDPEMLGTIFENLLAEIDPDTEKSARKSTGSFYTPREIVDYMVEQSLINYLKSKTKIDNENQLQLLFKEASLEPETFSEPQRIAMLNALSEVKILDPACGSGAFPMGCLHKIILALQKLDTDASWWKAKQLSYQKNAMSRQFLKEKLDNSNSDYIRKLGVIQNSIYGVDIQPIAAEISKLRSFLSLVIDENIDDNHIDGNRGILPLPNLEFKFVTANTLIGLDEGTANKTLQMDFGETETAIDELQDIRDSYLQTSGKDKEALKKQFEQKQNEIAKKEFGSGVTNAKTLQIINWKPFSNEGSGWFDPKWMFGVEKFDIVIGNPPWGAKLSTKDKENYKIFYEEIDSSTPNSFAYFCGNALKLSNTVLTFVLPDSILLKDFSKTRDLLKDNLIEISWYLNTGIPENFRPFIHVEHDVCVLIVNKKAQSKECKINKYLYDFGLKTSISQHYSVLKDDFILSEHSGNYNLLIREKEIELYNKLSSLERLNSKVQIHEGIHTGNSRDILFHDNKKNSNCKPLFYGGRAGDFIENFYSRRSKWFVDYRNDIVDKTKGFYASLRDERIFQLPKLYITRTGNPIKVFYDDDNYASNNFFSLQMKDYNLNSEDILKSILPLLLSSFSNYYIRTFCAPRLGETFVETKIIHLLKIPIPKLLFIDVEVQKKFKDLVNKIIGIKSISTISDTKALENEIDVMVYKLYELTYEEVLVIDTGFGLSEQEYENYKM